MSQNNKNIYGRGTERRRVEKFKYQRFWNYSEIKQSFLGLGKSSELQNLRPMYRQENRNHTLKSKEKGMKKTSQSLQKTRERDKRNRIVAGNYQFDYHYRQEIHPSPNRM